MADASQLARTDVVSELDDLEAAIGADLQAFVKVGEALARIRDGKLYRERGCKNFDEYCAARWGMTRQNAHRLMGSAHAAQNVKNSLPSDAALPMVESHAHVLSKLPPKEQPKAWREAVKTAPDGKLTAKHVAQVVAKRLPPKPAKAPKLQAVPGGEEEADEPRGDRSLDVALLELDDSLLTHLEAWEWDRASFVDALHDWVKRANSFFDRKERRRSNG